MKLFFIENKNCLITLLHHFSFTIHHFNNSMPTAIYQTQNIQYSITGKGQTLVLLHGFGEDSRMWTDFLPAFDAYQVLTIDLPGFGQSDLIAATIPVMAEAVKAVLDKEKIKKCTLIGHSMGGYVTLEFAKNHETRLLGFGLFHSHPYADTADKKKSRTKSIAFVEKHSVPIYLKQLMPLLFARNYAKTNAFVVDKMIYYGSQTSQAGIINGLQAMRDRADTTSVLKNTKVPVLFIVGKKDAAVSLENSLNQVHLPSISDIHILENVGHMGMFEAKKETIAAIHGFMEFCGG